MQQKTSRQGQRPTLSIVVTAHGEGILLHRTLRSALRASVKLDDKGIDWELLIHVDNATIETQEYITANQDFLQPFAIHYNSFKDLSASRNFMIGQAKGKYITFLDADDLISEQWLAAGVTYLQELGEPAVLHTEYLINFGKQNLVWQKYDSRSREEDALIMVWANRWDSAVMAPREVFETHPYAPNTKGFGSEDWHFGSQTLAAGVPHRVVPRTVLFARRRDVSEMSIQQTDFRTVHYTDLLDIDFFKTIDIGKTLGPEVVTTTLDRGHQSLNNLKHVSRKTAVRLYNVANRLPVLRPHIQTVKRLALAKLAAHRTPTANRFPKWLVEEWQAIHTIDKQIFPDKQLLATVPVYVSEMYELGITYRNLLQYVSAYPDYIVVVPHMVHGGADLVVLNYVHTLQTLHPDWHILVIATNDTPSPWAEKLPDSVDFMPWGRVCVESGIWQDLHLQLFARLIVQLRCKRLHIIQSALGFSFAEKYKRLLLENDYRVYACAFCEDVDDEGRFIGHIHSGLPHAYPALSRILTDNRAVIDQLANEYGLDEQRFLVHYQPAEIGDIQPPKHKASTPYRILWASRVTTQKRPDILKRIAERLDPEFYQLDAFGMLNGGYAANYFTGIPSLTYKGPFNGVESIATSDYDLFLYTSANDGVPNILLGMAAAGLPIVASNAGGVSEFIQNGKTGALIDPLEDIDAYVRAIDNLRQHPELAETYAKQAQQLLQTRHSQSAFQASVQDAKL